MARQMTFAEIGTLYNSISNELEGGVAQQNQAQLVKQVSTVQTQLQSLIDNGSLSNLDGAGNANVSAVHAQNVADQLNFLKAQIGTFGTDTYNPKFINDVVRDVQDIVAGDTALNALAHQNNHSGFQQVSFLLTPPTPFPDSGVQTTTLLQFVSELEFARDACASACGDRSELSSGPAADNRHPHVLRECGCLFDRPRWVVLRSLQQ